MATRLLAAPRLRLVSERSATPVDVWRRMYAMDGVPPPTMNSGPQGPQGSPKESQTRVVCFRIPISGEWEIF